MRHAAQANTAIGGTETQNAPRHQPISAKMPPIGGPTRAAMPQVTDIAARIRVLRPPS